MICSTYDVTGISPQSRTLAQLLKGLVAKGTLYPPLKRTLREPCSPFCVSLGFFRLNVLEVEAARTLPDAAGAKASSGTVGGSGIKGSACFRLPWSVYNDRVIQRPWIV